MPAGLEQTRLRVHFQLPISAICCVRLDPHIGGKVGQVAPLWHGSIEQGEGLTPQEHMARLRGGPLLKSPRGIISRDALRSPPPSCQSRNPVGQNGPAGGRHTIVLGKTQMECGIWEAAASREADG